MFRWVRSREVRMAVFPETPGQGQPILLNKHGTNRVKILDQKSNMAASQFSLQFLIKIFFFNMVVNWLHQ